MAIECQKSRLEIERVFLAESYGAEAPFDEAITVRVSDDVFRFLSDEKTPQGILCRVRIPSGELTPPTGKCIFLDGVADPGNVGTILRTANAAGYKKAYLSADCADPYSPKCVRASMSGVFFMEICRGEREEILSVLREKAIVVADMGGENVFEFLPPSEYTLVIGNEANGISPTTHAVASHTVKIPMQSTQESLNAAVSAGIIMYVLANKTGNE